MSSGDVTDQVGASRLLCGDCRGAAARLMAEAPGWAEDSCNHPQEGDGGESGGEGGGQMGRRCSWQQCRGEVASYKADLQAFFFGLGIGTQTSQSRKHVS